MRRLGDWRSRKARSGHIDMAPLIDMVFILLLFFLVTSTFDEERALDIERPTSQSAATIQGEILRVGLGAEGTLYWQGEPIELEEYRRRCRDFAEGHPQGGLVIVADADLALGSFVRVADVARGEGVVTVSLATREDEPR